MSAHDVPNPERIADNCPECLEGPNVPSAVAVGESSVMGLYGCRACRHTWTCSWALSVLNDPEDDAAGEPAVTVTNPHEEETP
jgi:hypothetical protein